MWRDSLGILQHLAHCLIPPLAHSPPFSGVIGCHKLARSWEYQCDQSASELWLLLTNTIWRGPDAEEADKGWALILVAPKLGLQWDEHLGSLDGDEKRGESEQCRPRWAGCTGAQEEVVLGEARLEFKELGMGAACQKQKPDCHCWWDHGKEGDERGIAHSTHQMLLIRPIKWWGTSSQNGSCFPVAHNGNHDKLLYFCDCDIRTQILKFICHWENPDYFIELAELFPPSTPKTMKLSWYLGLHFPCQSLLYIRTSSCQLCSLI